MRHTTSVVVYILFASVIARAQTSSPPVWWTAPVTIFANDTPTDNWAIANVGQLKHVATKAKTHLDAKLNLTSSDWNEAYSNTNPFPFPVGTSIDNHAPLNIGQLKFVASGFYRILHQKAPNYSVPARLGSLGVPASAISGSGPYYPWSETTGLGENWSPVTIGQLKIVFSFDLSNYVVGTPEDTDADGLLDAWEIRYYSGLNANPSEDTDGDGLTNLREYELGCHPRIQDNPAIGFAVFTPAT